MAVKVTMVSGLVTVMAKVLAVAEATPRAGAAAAASRGLARKVARPRPRRMSPPRSATHICCARRKPDMAVRPRAATKP